MSTLNETMVRSIIMKTTIPVVFRGYVDSWPIRQWNLEKWTEIFGQREYPFRCLNKFMESPEPCWETKCTSRKMTFKKFIEAANSSGDAMYFDYKYLHEWFSEEEELHKVMSWKRFGFPEKGPIDTTLWVGSDGAHTPAHQDTYGVNIVAQVYGKKRWILFPPESGGLQPTRVPYEESSVYSGLNFYCPNDVQVFKELTGAHVVDLSAGDALLVPHKWWHYVQNEDSVNISLNMWLPHDKDSSARMSEAVIKIFVAQLCKDLPTEEIKLLVNPTEDDLTDTPLADLLLQLKAAKDQCLDKKRNKQQTKRHKTNDSDVSTSHAAAEYDLRALVENPDNKTEIPATITGEELVRVIEETKSRYKSQEPSSDIEKEPGTSSSFSTIKNIINAFCRDNVVDQVKQNLFSYPS